MIKTSARDRQTLFDIALEQCGSVEAVFDLAFNNGLSLSDDIEVGTELNIPNVVDPHVTTSWKRGNVEAATAIDTTPDFSDEGEATDPSRPASLEGIGYWSVGGSFIVS